MERPQYNRRVIASQSLASFWFYRMPAGNNCNARLATETRRHRENLTSGLRGSVADRLRNTKPLLINAICPWVLCKAKSAPADFEAPGKKREHPLFILASCESVEVDVPGPGHHPKLLRLRRHVEHAF